MEVWQFTVSEDKAGICKSIRERWALVYKIEKSLLGLMTRAYNIMQLVHYLFSKSIRNTEI